jgi:(2S)-methylsuccinyl-CoA dehydrogenase
MGYGVCDHYPADSGSIRCEYCAAGWTVEVMNIPDNTDTAPSTAEVREMLLGIAEDVVRRAALRLGEVGEAEKEQVFAYELAHVASGVAAVRAATAYSALGGTEAALFDAFFADVIHDLYSKTMGRERLWGVDPGMPESVRAYLEQYRGPEFLAGLWRQPGERHLNEEMDLVRATFRAFATDQIAPHAEHVHRNNGDVPESVISGLAELGAFGLSVPCKYGGFSGGGAEEYLAMVVATEELSRSSLVLGGSLITRPEILTRALVKGGTEEQKHHWLPRLASGEVMPAVAVSEPDYGSDVANLTTTATPAPGPDGEPGYVINGVKTWCTFGARADVLALLARTDPDRARTHRGLSLFIVEKPRGESRGFVFTQELSTHGSGDLAGRMEGRPIDTIGYRGMHSYEIALENWWVPAANLVGEESGLGRGFYYQMEGFENGRLQTAARAVGVMQAAYEAAVSYAENRRVFGQNLVEYQLTRAKLGRMAAVIQVSRQFAYRVAGLMGQGLGAAEASMVKAYVCRASEWVTREAVQIHGGMGYAEEYPVSRLFVDARVLSIFEGADETLCLKVIARHLTATP